MTRTNHLQIICRNRYWLSQFAWAHVKLPVSGSEGSGVLSRGVKQSENEADFIYEVMNVQNDTSTLPCSRDYVLRWFFGLWLTSAAFRLFVCSI